MAESPAPRWYRRRPWPGRRPRPLVLAILGVAAALLVGVGGFVYASWRVTPAPSSIDTKLDGVIQPADVAQPSPPPKRTIADFAEQPCWPTYGRSALRNSDGSDLDHGIPKTLTWKVRVGIMEFPPAYCDGVIYVNNQKGFTYAIQVHDHKTLWKRRTAKLYDSTPGIGGSRVFVGSYDPPAVQALDRRTGRRLWKLTAGGPVETSPLVVGDVVFAASKDRRVYALDAATGRVRWAYRTGGEIKNSPSMWKGRLLVANYAGEVLALRAKDGSVAWRRNLTRYGSGLRIYASVAVSGNTAYVATISGEVHALDAKTGRTRWTSSMPGYVYSTPAVGDGRVFVGSYSRELHAFDAKTGRRLWKDDVGGSISGSAAIIGDVVYVSSNGKQKTWGYSVTNGRRLWTYGEGKYVPAIATDDAIYLSTGSFLSRWRSSQSEARLVAERAAAREARAAADGAD